MLQSVLRSRRATRWAFLSVAGLALSLTIGSSLAAAAAGGPFRPFLGDWRGSGRVTTTGGQTEKINCRATYEGADSDQSLTISLICASDSYRFNVQSNVVADGHSLRGQWQETSRGVQGDLSGDVTKGDFEGSVSGAGFTAQMSIRTSGRKQAVSIRPSAGDVASVEVSLTRQK